MKKKFLAIGAIAFAFLIVVACAVGLIVGKNNTEIDPRNKQIVAVYEAYVVYAREKGGERPFRMKTGLFQLRAIKARRGKPERREPKVTRVKKAKPGRRDPRATNERKATPESAANPLMKFLRSIIPNIPERRKNG